MFYFLERLGSSFENSQYIGNCHSVIADRNPGMNGRHQAIPELSGCNHAASALYD